jgi:protein TonB
MIGVFRNLKPEQWAGLALVLAAHLGVFYALWSARLLPVPAAVATVFVNFITPPQPPAPKPKLLVKPLPPVPVKLERRPTPPETPHTHLVVDAPVTSPTEPVAPPPVVAAPVVVEAPAPPPKPTGPITLSADLAVGCPQRTPPSYPALSRRLGETGKVVVRVELAENGQVSTASVDTSSGHARLDQAALNAVKTWRCTPALRDGRAVRAVALQPFNFTLEGQ